MALRKVQRVVLRSKVREERRRKLAAFFSFFFRGALFLGLAGGAILLGRRFLFRSDFFIIKSFEIATDDEKLKEGIGAVLSGVKGRPLLTLSTRRLESDLASRFPQIRSFNVSRSLPGRLKVAVVPRRPLAVYRNAGAAQDESQAAFVDDSGSVFRADGQKEGASLPFLVVHSSALLPQGLGFLKSWEAAGGAGLVWNSSAALPEVPAGHDGRTGGAAQHKVSVDESGEVVLYADGGTRVVWGRYAPETFAEKFERFRAVWKDLEAKAMPAEYINLREVPQARPAVPGDREVVGRVIVRPVKGWQKSRPPAAKKSGGRI